MRYALISDIHANLTALQCVLSDISKNKVDKIICLGDSMGYGPQPAETLELVYQVAEFHLLGNHDAAVCGKLNPVIFSSSAKKAVLKHRNMVSEKALHWMESMPLTCKTPSFFCSHGDFTKPGAYKYIISAEDSLPSFETTREQLMFVGHTHLAGIYVIGPSGVPHYLTPRDFILEDGKRYIINPGTVGYPRCGKFESTYCIFDSDERSIVFRHIPFDHVAYNNALNAAGFDEIPWIKSKTAELTLPEVRERLSFTKPLSDEHHLKETLKNLQKNHSRQVRKYRFLIIAVTLISLVSASFMINHIIRAKKESSSVLSVPPGKLKVISPDKGSMFSKNFLQEFPQQIALGDVAEGWRYIISDKAEQSVEITRHITGNSFRITNQKQHRFILESPLIEIADSGLKYLRMNGRIRKMNNFKGNVFYQLQSYAQAGDGTLEKYKVDSYEVRGRTNEGNDSAAITRKIPLNKKTTHVCLRIESDFTGVLDLRQPLLYGHDDSIPSAGNGEENIP